MVFGQKKKGHNYSYMDENVTLLMRSAEFLFHANVNEAGVARM